MLYSKILLFIYFIYSSLYLLIPNSLFIPPPPSFLFGNHKFAFYVCMFLFHKKVRLCYILDSTCKCYHMAFVFLFLISFKVIISRSIHVAGMALFHSFLSFFFFFFIVVGFVIHWNESAMDLHVFPILIPPSHLPLHPISLGLPSAPGPSACLMHPTWAGDLFHPR